MENPSPDLTKSQFALLVATIYLTMTMMGTNEMSSLVALPMMKTYFDVPDYIWGIFSSMMGGCYLVGCVLASFILKGLGFKAMFLSSFIVNLTGCILLQFTKSFWPAAICVMLTGISNGLFEISTNAASTATFKKNSATWMMLMQTCFGLGATLSPIVCKLGVKYFHHDFFSCFVAIGIIMATVFVFVIFVPIPIKFSKEDDPKPDVESSSPSADYTWWSTLSSGSAWICAFSIGMMEAVETGNNTWAPLYLQDVLHLDPLTDLVRYGTWLQVLFTISRFISGPIIDYIGYFPALYFSNIMNTLLLITGFLLGKKGPYAFVVMSFFYAWFWPTNICVFMNVFKNNAPLASSHIIVMQSLMNLPDSIILGAINSRFGQQWAFRLLLVFSALSLIALTVMLLLYRRLEKGSKEEVTTALTDNPRQ